MNHEEAHIQAHERAIANQTAESYLLGDLSEAENDAFEEHYFGCVVCAETVRAGAAMLATGRQVVPRPVPAPLPFPVKKRLLSAWLSQAAAAVFAVALGVQHYSHVIRPGIELVQSASISMNARGGPNDNVYRLAEDKKLSLSFDVPPGFDYQTYDIGVRTARGKTIDTKSISAETAKSPQLLVLRNLAAGSYVLIIEGVREDGKREPIKRKGFTVQR